MSQTKTLNRQTRDAVHDLAVRVYRACEKAEGFQPGENDWSVPLGEIVDRWMNDVSGNEADLGALEELIYSRYTRVDRFFNSPEAALHVAGQTFRIAGSGVKCLGEDASGRIEWYRRMLAAALARLVTEVAREVSGTEADLGG